jgi:hypothetical protein
LGGTQFEVDGDNKQDLLVQNNHDAKWNMHGVRHLFVDDDGNYNSGPIRTEDCPMGSDLFMVSGVFFNDLDRENEAIPDLFDEFKHAQKISLDCGYATLPGLHFHKSTIHQDYYASVQEQNIDEEKKEASELMDELLSKEISNIDMLRLSKRCKFLDFRLKRTLMEFYKERVAPKKKLDHPYKHANILKGLTR